MANTTPQATVSETNDTLDIASQAVASMVPQTAAPASDPSVSLGNTDQVQAKQKKESVMKQTVQEPLKVDNHKTTATNESQGVISSKADSDSDVEMIDHTEDVCPPPKSAAEISMLDKYAFDLEGKAYNHNVPQQLTTATFLYVGRLHPQHTSLAEHCKEAESKDEMDTCPPLVPDENEMNPEIKTWDGRKPIECVWVGMLPGWKTQIRNASGLDEAQVDGPAGKKTGVPKKAKHALRIADLTSNSMSIIPYDPAALRVVAKISTKVTKNWFLYALLNPEPATKLCQGWRVGFDEVFYFKAFRADEATSYLPRKQVTQENIRALIFYGEPSNSASLSDSKQPGSLPSTPPTGKFSQKSGGLPSPPSTGRSSEQLSKKPVSENTGNAVEADPEFNDMVDLMVQIVNGAESKILKEKAANAKKAGVKRKNVSFEGDNGKASDTYGNTVSSLADSTSADDDLGAEAKSLATQHDVNRVTTKMMNLVMKMSNDKDLVALSQGYMMLKCIEQRCVPPTTSALGLYLNVPPEEGGDPPACAMKLRELLGLFPQVEDVDMDNHMLAWVTRGLQVTSQSIDLELLPFYLTSFSALFKAKFEDTSNHQARLRKDDLVNMTCQARNDAEKMWEKETSPNKKPNGIKCPSHPYAKDVRKIWKAFDWIDPREGAVPEEDAESVEL